MASKIAGDWGELFLEAVGQKLESQLRCRPCGVERDSDPTGLEELTSPYSYLPHSIRGVAGMILKDHKMQAWSLDNSKSTVL